MANKILVGSNFTGFKNRIINGDFSVWQRGTSFTLDAGGVDLNSFKYTADRFLSYIHSSAVTINKYVESNENTIEAIMTTNYDDGTQTSNAYIDLRQRIEFLHLYAGKTFTLSFWAKADEANKLSIHIGRKWNAADPVYYTLVKVEENWFDTVWKKYEISFTVPTMTDDGATTYDGNVSYLEIVIRHQTYNATTPTVYYKNIQLEEGDIATEFEYVPYGIQLLRCQRYFEKLDVAVIGSHPGSNSGYATWSFITEKRAVPSMTILKDSTYPINTKYVGTQRYTGYYSGYHAIILAGSTADAEL